MLIRRVETLEFRDGGVDSRLCDLRLADGRIQLLAEPGSLRPRPDERLLEGDGRLLLPGLQDHHLHFRSLAAAEASLVCGPPEVFSAAELSRRLTGYNPLGDWVRGVGYHESVAGDLDRAWLDARGPDRPVRIQHRSGRLWILNSAALALLEAETRASLPKDGRLFDRDELLHRMSGDALPVQQLSERLAGYGVTGFNDMTPGNLASAADWFHERQKRGELLQRVRLSGHLRLRVAADIDPTRLARGETKFHLHEDRLPEFDRLCADIRASHAEARPVAFHAVTRTVLVYVLAALAEAGRLAGDRIEHASVAPPELIEALAESGALVVTQPNFVAERGDAYLRELPAAEHGYLYPCASLARAGVRPAFGSDAPFGEPDPWFAMRAAVQRRTASGQLLGADESLSPEDALRGFLGTLASPGARASLAAGDAADLVLLDAPWRQLRENLHRRRVLLTLIDGEPVYRRDAAILGG